MIDLEKEPEVPKINRKTKEKTQEEIDEVVEQLAKFEITQRKNEGDEEGHEGLSNYWLRFKYGM